VKLFLFFYQGDSQMFLKNFRSYQLSLQFYHLSKKVGVKGTLKDQLERASSSIALNLAEGAGKHKHYAADSKKHYRIALGSLRECQAILDLQTINGGEIKTIADRLGSHLYKLTL
jgi:four helix bundle protein